MKKLVAVVGGIGLVVPLAWAGVVIELEVRTPGAQGAAAIDTIYVEGEALRMDPHPRRETGRLSMIFRDEQLWVVDHDAKSCQTIDKQGIQQVASRLGDAMQQMQAELAKLPPEQRAMVEKMMKGKMPPGISMAGEPEAPRRLESGAVAQVGSYSCKVYTLYSGDEKVWEVCAAPTDELSGVAEAMGAFRAMSRFVEQLRDSMRELPFAGMVATPFHDLHQIDGFPVRVRSFRGGQTVQESTLKSIAQRDLERSLFSPPRGYESKSLVPN